MSDFTSGPWRALKALRRTADGRDVVEIADQSGLVQIAEADGTRKHANARLIAAAPDLLTALINITGRFEAACAFTGNDAEMIAAATGDVRAVIARATGQPDG